MLHLILAATCLLSAPAAPQFGFDIPPDVMEELGLTEAQQNEIETLLKTTETKIIKYRAEAQTKQVELRSELKQDAPSEAAVKKLAREIGDIHTEMKILGLETAVKIKKIVGPEKLKEAKKLMKENRATRRARFRGMRQNAPAPPPEGDD